MLNTEFDSRVVRVSAGPAGVTRPRVSPEGLTPCLLYTSPSPRD